MSKTKLRPCPFCGNAVDVEMFHPRQNEYSVTCLCCGAESGHALTKADAIASWNERDGQSLNDQLWCLVEIRKLIGDPEAKLMQPELIERVRDLVVRREAAKGEK